MTQELTTTNQQLDLAHARPGAFAMTTFADVEKIAENISKAKAFGFKEPAQVVTAIFLAQDEGKTLAQLMREVHFHEDGKISNRADHLQARFEKEAGKIIWHVRTDEICCGSFILGTEITDEQRKRAEERMDLMLDLDAATWNDPRNMEKELKLTKAIAKLNREGEVTVLRTLADADSKGISMGKNGQKNNWTTSSRAMLQWRCVTEAVNVVASHLRNGRSSDIDLFDLKAQEDKQRQRVITAPTITEGDAEHILKIIAEYDAELATDIPDARRKYLLGNRTDLKIKLEEIGVKPPAEPEAPKPTVASVEAKTVEAVVLPPEKTEATTKQPAARQQRPKPQTPAAPADDLDMTPTATTQGMDTPWREFICLRGQSPGMMHGHTLESIFLNSNPKLKPDTAPKLDKLVGWFTSQAIHTSSDAHDKILWAKVQEADKELRLRFDTTEETICKVCGYKRGDHFVDGLHCPSNLTDAGKPLASTFAAGTTVAPASTQTTPAAEKPAQQAASPTRWQDFVIPGKHPDYAGKTLGSLGPDGVKRCQDEYLSQIDWAKATIQQRSLKANVALAMAELHPAAKAAADAATDGPDDHTKALVGLVATYGWDAGFFLTTCKLNRWIAEERRRVEDITAAEYATLEDAWPKVEEEMAKTEKQP